MIRATIEKNSRVTKINFPCNDEYLFNQLKQIGVINPFDCTHEVINADIDNQPFSELNGAQVNLDFLNFLAKRLDSFDKRELAQFRAAQYVKQSANIKDLINLTYNLHNFTLIADFSDMKKVGERHYLNVNMAMPVSEKESVDFTAIGKQLVSTGTGKVTPYGVLFENQLPCEEIFNSQTIPQYFYEECAFSITVSKAELSETLYLPTEELTIQKALKRLGAAGIENCTVDNIDSSQIPVSWLNPLCSDYSALDIFAFNRFSKATEEFESSDFEKLLAVADYADIHDLDEATRIAENIGSFLYIPGIHDAESLGKQQIKESCLYKYDEQLEDFYNYEMFGNSLLEYQEGKFIDSGYVGVDDDSLTLADILETGEQHGIGDMRMG